MKKYVLNLFTASVGILRFWDVVVERRHSLIGLWLLPVMFLFLVWLNTSHAFTDVGWTAGFFSFLVLACYGVIWLIASLKDAINVSPQSEMTHVSIVIAIPIAIITILWPASSLFGLFVASESSESQVFQAIPGWVYAHVFLIVILALSLAVIALLKTNRWRVTGLSSASWTTILPVFGLQGVPYVARKEFGKGIGFLLTGIACGILLLWVALSEPSDSVDSRWVLSAVVLYTAPLLYTGMWLWTIADVYGQGEREEDEGLETKSTSRSPKRLLH